jgi:hemoglobin-like flavoprotein
MTPNQIDLIKQSWTAVQPIAEAVPELFYTNLFEIDPGTRPLFAKTDMTRQHAKLLEALQLVVECAGNISELVPALEDLGKRHVRYGVSDRQYDSVGQALLVTLEQGLGDTFTDETREAWATAYGLIADTMRKGASLARAA